MKLKLCTAMLVGAALCGAAGESFELGDLRVMSGPEVNARFPRLVAANNGDLLLTYKVGSAHASSDAAIVLRISHDRGKTWGPERNLCAFEQGVSAQNVILLPVLAGRVIAWVSRYEYSKKGHERASQVWSVSEDNGATWRAWQRFDASNERSSYYMTDAIALANGKLLAVDATFPAAGAGSCYAQAWRSEDRGDTWRVVSRLTEPAENLGDEVGLIETKPGEVLCLLRDRRGKSTHRLWSRDDGQTWTKREDLGAMVGCFQRPLLTRLDERTILATGRDRQVKATVAFVSRDNGRTFGERFVIEAYKGDGAYTGVVALSAREVLITWYSDHGRNSGQPVVKLANLRLK